jgi:hypothetical protein
MTLSMVFSIAVVECGSCTLKHVNDVHVGDRIFDCAARIGNAASIGPVNRSVDHLLGIAHDCNVWIMRYHDDLATRLDSLNHRDKQEIDGLLSKFSSG